MGTILLSARPRERQELTIISTIKDDLDQCLSMLSSDLSQWHNANLRCVLRTQMEMLTELLKRMKLPAFRQILENILYDTKLRVSAALRRLAARVSRLLCPVISHLTGHISSRGVCRCRWCEVPRWVAAAHDRDRSGSPVRIIYVLM